MSKIMAIISNNTVTNVGLYLDSEEENEILKDTEGRPVGIGDTYANRKFYHEGAEVLTPLEEAQREIDALKSENADMKSALNIMGVE